MSNCLIGYKIHSDHSLVALSNGDWETALPLTNLQDRRSSRVARSVDAALASTKFDVDLAVSRYIAMTGLFGHNLTLDALVRIRGHNYSILYEPGEAIVAPFTFARADTAQYVDADGVVQTAASGVLRDGHYEDGTRLTLLEAAYTNLITSDDIDGGWSSVNTPVITTGVADPAGGTGAFTIADNDGAVVEYKYLAVTFTGDGTKTVVWVVNEATMASAGNQSLRLEDVTAGTFPIQLPISAWVSGVPQITPVAGTLVDIVAIGNGYHAVVGTGTVTAGNTHRVRIMPAVTNTATGSITVWRVNAFNAPFPPRSILSASEATTADLLKRAITFTPGSGYTVYAKIRNAMLANTGSAPRVFALGNYGAAGGAVEVACDNGSNAWSLFTRTTGGGQVESNLGSGNAPTVGDDFEFRVSVPATGNITWGVSKSAGTEATTTHTPGTWDAAFNSLYLTIGADGAGTNQGTFGLYDLKIYPAAGRTMAQMRAYETDSGWDRAYPQIYPSTMPEWIATADQTGYPSQEDYDDGMTWPHIYVPATPVSARYWRVEINDTANPDGYVDIGRLVLSSGWQSSINFVPGATLGWITSSTRTETDGGAAYHNAKPARRVFACTIENMDEDEAMVHPFELARYLGTDKQVMFVYNPADTYHLQRRSFLATLEKLSPLQIPYGSWMSNAIALIEEL